MRILIFSPSIVCIVHHRPLSLQEITKMNVLEPNNHAVKQSQIYLFHLLLFKPLAFICFGIFILSTLFNIGIEDTTDKSNTIGQEV